MSGCDIGICPSSPVCLLCIRRNRMLKQMELDNHPTTATKKSTPISAALVNIKTNTLIVESYEQLFPVFLEIFPQYSRYSLSLFIEILSTTALAPIIASVVALCLSWNRFPIYYQIPPLPASGSIDKFRAHFRPSIPGTAKHYASTGADFAQSQTKFGPGSTHTHTQSMTRTRAWLAAIQDSLGGHSPWSQILPVAYTWPL